MVSHTDTLVDPRGELVHFFRAEWYLQRYLDVNRSAFDPLEHYLKHGAWEGRYPNPFFDSEWYARNYLAGQTNVNPLYHYLTEGMARGYGISASANDIYLASRDGQPWTLADLLAEYTVITESWLFESEWYLIQNPDVAAAGVDPLAHYIVHGSLEGRPPNRFFMPGWYLQSYEDARGAGNPLLHYLYDGALRNCSTCPGLPDVAFRRKHNRKRPAHETPLGQLLKSLTLIERSFLFERDWYADRYRNVADAGVDPLLHFVLHGVGESYNPNRLFDVRWYLSEYPHVAEAGDNPLTHYIEAGSRLGYLPHPYFPIEAYTQEATADQSHTITSLERFLTLDLASGARSFPVFSDYDVYRFTKDNSISRDIPDALQHIDLMMQKPHFSILVTGNDAASIEITSNSLNTQTYRNCDLVTFSTGDRTMLQGSHFLWLKAGDALLPHALYSLASAINADPECDMIYFDHDERLSVSRLRPHHKPQWSPDLLESHDYVRRAVCYRAELFGKLVPVANCPYDLLLRVAELGPSIRHLADVLLRLDINCSDEPWSRSREQEALAGRLQRTGRTGRVEGDTLAPDRYQLDIDLPDRPLVSIVIPTAGKIIKYRGKSIDLLAQCVSTILDQSTYKNVEIIVVDNGDLDRARIHGKYANRVRYCTYTEPVFNMASKMNMGVSHASGEFIVTFNDDIAAKTQDWIERMLHHFQKPHVGMVGARLLYPNNTLQHIGMVISDGHSHHIMAGRPADDPGYDYAALTVRNCVGVTGATAMIRRSLYLSSGGYPLEFPIDYNDAALCFQIRRLGYSIVYEPHAELYHHHAVSVERTPRPEDQTLFWRSWPEFTIDPYYNQNVFERQPPLTYLLRYSDKTT